MLPNRDFAAAIRFCRFVLAVLASLVGMIGIVVGVLLLFAHLLGLKSMGVSYVGFFSPGLIRKKLKNEKYRDKKMEPKDKRKQR